MWDSSLTSVLFGAGMQTSVGLEPSGNPAPGTPFFLHSGSPELSLQLVARKTWCWQPGKDLGAGGVGLEWF